MPIRTTSLRSTLLLFALIACASPALTEPLTIPGTQVSLEAPPGFVLSGQFSGLENEELVSSIVVSELAAPIDRISGGFTAERLKSQGMMLRTAERAEVSGREAELAHVTQEAHGATFEKWLVAFGDASTSVLIVATYPQALSSELREPMRAAALSATWARGKAVDPFEGLAFRLRETKALGIHHRLQNMLLLSERDEEGPSPGAPILVVGSSHSPKQVDDLELFARQRIVLTDTITALRDLEGRDLEVAGRPAYELTAHAKDVESGEPLVVYQVLLTRGQVYYLIQGLVSTSRAEAFLVEFRKVTESFEFVDGG